MPGKDLSGKDPAMSLRTLAPCMKKGNSKILAYTLTLTIARNVLLETVDDMCLSGLTVYVFLGSCGHWVFVGKAASGFCYSSITTGTKNIFLYD